MINYAGIILWLAVSFFCSYLQAQSAGAAEPLLVTAPIRKAATKRMSVNTKIYGSGEIAVYATLPNIQLTPGPARSMPDRERRGDWFAFFYVTPKMSPSDAKAFLELARKSKQTVIEKARKMGSDLKMAEGEGDSYFRNLANVVSSDYAYRVSPASSIPASKHDRDEIGLFLQNLSDEVKTVDQTDTHMFLRDLLLPDPPMF